MVLNSVAVLRGGLYHSVLMIPIKVYYRTYSYWVKLLFTPSAVKLRVGSMIVLEHMRICVHIVHELEMH